MANHRVERRAWLNMRYRCEGRTARNRRYYSERGIVVCPEWLGPDGFARFLADVGPRPGPGHTLARIDMAGNYEPGNVRWTSCRTRNRSRAPAPRGRRRGPYNVSVKQSVKTQRALRLMALKYAKET